MSGVEPCQRSSSAVVFPHHLLRSYYEENHYRLDPLFVSFSSIRGFRGGHQRGLQEGQRVRPTKKLPKGHGRALVGAKGVGEASPGATL